jgi:hypothetical protein
MVAARLQSIEPKGTQVTILEMLDKIAGDMGPTSLEALPDSKRAEGLTGLA